MRTNCGHATQKKNAKSLFLKDLAFLKSTQSRDRTGTGLTPLVFETSASTNSAIWANIYCFAGANIKQSFLYTNNYF